MIKHKLNKQEIIKPKQQISLISQAVEDYINIKPTSRFIELWRSLSPFLIGQAGADNFFSGWVRTASALKSNEVI